MSYYGYWGWRPYVSVAERRRNAAREMEKLRKKGHPVSPVTVDGRTIARTFWGGAWCDNLECYSDYSNRLPRGRTYVRNGSVVDLQIAPGEVRAWVSGSELYQVAVKVKPVPAARWASICSDCAGGIDSLVELLGGRFSKGVMERLCRQKAGLFPQPSEISFTCSCPDWASMCKHVAAVLYGIGARLDERPELLFTLRKVDGSELVAKASRGVALSKKGPAKEKVLAADDLADVVGIELDTPGSGRARTSTRARCRRTQSTAAASPRAGARGAGTRSGTASRAAGRKRATPRSAAAKKPLARRSISSR
ncbi:MAG: hypothetical protein E4H11_05805 [Myxococcales bacterium]|nr:MAG: hypothetical protein E4H11_05805 [Myxococcales bacterium]